MPNPIREESAHSINGVQGRMFNLHRPPAPWEAGTFASQTWSSVDRSVKGYGPGAVMSVAIRFDDNCKNGHNSFAITANITTPASRRRNDIEAGGCLHTEIAKYFPELAHLIQWHLVSTDSPLHYVANTAYHASDRDHRGFAKGEACSFAYGFRFADSPITNIVSDKFFKWINARREFNTETLKTNPAHGEFIVVAIAHENKPGDTYKFKPKYTFNGFGEVWHDCPFDSQIEAQEFALALNTCRVETVTVPTAYSDGKERNLNAARNCGVWPDATDPELCVPRAELEAALQARLPALIAAFRADIEGAGFMWECPAA